MISLEAFARQLKSAKVPFYAYPKFEPSEVFEKYKFGILSGTREISTFTSSKNSRQKEVYRLDKRVQQRIWNKLIKVKQLYPYVIAVSSSVNDYLAHEVASTLLLSLVRNFTSRLTWNWYTPKWDPYITKGVRPDVVLIRSVLPIEERLYEIRDILDYYYNSLRIVVLGGTNGIDFFDNYLHHPLNGAFHIEGYKGNIPKDLWVKDESKQILDNDEYKYPIFTVDDEGKNILQKFII